MRSEAGERPASWCASDPVSSETSHRAEMPCALSPACLTPNRQALGVVCTYRPTHGDRSRWTRAHQVCRSSCEPLLGNGLLVAECRGRVAISRCAHINTLETRQCQDAFCDRIIACQYGARGMTCYYPVELWINCVVVESRVMALIYPVQATVASKIPPRPDIRVNVGRHIRRTSVISASSPIHPIPPLPPLPISQSFLQPLVPHHPQFLDLPPIRTSPAPPGLLHQTHHRFILGPTLLGGNAGEICGAHSPSMM